MHPWATKTFVCSATGSGHLTNIFQKKWLFELFFESFFTRCHHLDFKIGPVRFYFNPITSIASAIIIWGFVGYCIADPPGSLKNMKSLKNWVTEKWTWLYVGTQDVWAVFIIALYFSKYSNMKLGRLRIFYGKVCVIYSSWEKDEGKLIAL